jgi:hypothetical protein
MIDIADIIGDGFDASAYEPMADGFAPLVPGWYPVEIEKAEVKQNNKKTGAYIKFQLSVIGDKYANRKLFPLVNIQNTKYPKCEYFGLSQLASIKIALGIPNITSTDQLIGGQLDVRVVTSKETNNKGEYESEVKAYAPLGSGGEQKAPQSAAPAKPAAVAPQSATRPAAPSVASAPAAVVKRPWER